MKIIYRRQVIHEFEGLQSEEELQQLFDQLAPSEDPALNEAQAAELASPARAEQQYRELLAEQGFDPIYGARPLRRTIQKEIIQPLAMRLLQGEFADGDTILLDAEEGRLAFKKSEAATAVRA